MHRLSRLVAGLALGAAIGLPAYAGHAATVKPADPAASTSAASASAPSSPGLPEFPADGNGSDGGEGGGKGDDGNNGNQGGTQGNNGNNGNHYGNPACGEGVQCSGAPALGWPLLAAGFGAAVLIAALRQRRSRS